MNAKAVPPPRLREIRRLRDIYLIAQPPLLSIQQGRSLCRALTRESFGRETP
jgi:hypothetical protein